MAQGQHGAQGPCVQEPGASRCRQPRVAAVRPLRWCPGAGARRASLHTRAGGRSGQQPFLRPTPRPPPPGSSNTHRPWCQAQAPRPAQSSSHTSGQGSRRRYPTTSPQQLRAAEDALGAESQLAKKGKSPRVPWKGENCSTFLWPGTIGLVGTGEPWSPRGPRDTTAPRTGPN